MQEKSFLLSMVFLKKRKIETCKRVVSFFLFLLCLTFFSSFITYSQTTITKAFANTTNTHIEEKTFPSTAPSSTTLPTTTDSTPLAISTTSTTSSSQNNLENSQNNTTLAPPTDFSQNAEFAWQKYLQAIGTMIFFLILLWYAMKLVKKYGEGRFLPNQKLLPKSSMYLEGQLSLGPNKCVTIVNVLNKRLVLAVTEKDITLLTELKEELSSNIPDGFNENLINDLKKNPSRTLFTNDKTQENLIQEGTNKVQENSQEFQKHLNAEINANK